MPTRANMPFRKQRRREVALDRLIRVFPIKIKNLRSLEKKGELTKAGHSAMVQNIKAAEAEYMALSRKLGKNTDDTGIYSEPSVKKQLNL